MLQEKLKPFLQKFDSIEESLNSPDISKNIKKLTELSKERTSILPLVEKAKEYNQVMSQIVDNKSLLDDKEFSSLAKEELKSLNLKKESLEEDIKILILPKDKNDSKNILLEIRAGTGGDEASIFSGDLFKLYTRYAESNGWKVEIVSISDGDAGGYKEIIAQINGENVYSKLKYEAGTHRVQRVPETESQGRVHTSASTVAVIPEAEDIDIDFNLSDLKIDVFRAGGNGGQSVNTTDSAVRVTHVPTGLVVSIQDEKSQHKNKDKAIKILKARLYEETLMKQQKELASERKTQVGSGDRSERIRTYNYPQNRITDHRIGLTLYTLSETMLSGDLNPIIEQLISHDQAEKIKMAGL